MLKNSLYSIIAILLGLFCLTTYADIPQVQAAQTNTSQSTIPTDANLLFLQTASSATIDPIKGRNGYYYLLLINTGPYITYFTKRPLRANGLASINQFLKAWNLGSNNLNVNPPNGVIIASTINGQPNTSETPLLVILSNPAYIASRNIMRYVIKPLGSQDLFSDPISLGNLTLVFGA